MLLSLTVELYQDGTKKIDQSVVWIFEYFNATFKVGLSFQNNSDNISVEK